MPGARMSPIRDEQGNLRPDLDFREVTRAVMAEYLSVDPSTLWRRVINGDYTGCYRRHGTVAYFFPRKVLRIA